MRIRCGKGMLQIILQINSHCAHTWFFLCSNYADLGCYLFILGGVRFNTYHGHFMLRSTDLLALPAVDCDKAFAMQLNLDETLLTIQTVYFQVALLYPSASFFFFFCLSKLHINMHVSCLFFFQLFTYHAVHVHCQHYFCTFCISLNFHYTVNLLFSGIPNAYPRHPKTKKMPILLYLFWICLV